jgi:prepilin-type processing-associated H-X9-DG protein
MALTEIPIELSSTPSIVDGGNATAITIDSSENVTLAGTLAVTGLTTVKTDGSGYAIKLVENSGSENYQIGVDSYGGLVFYNETTKAAEFNDTGGFNTYGNVIFNEDSADLDFRVESNGNANMLFVDGGANTVGIGCTPDTDTTLHVNASGSTASTSIQAGTVAAFERSQSTAGAYVAIIGATNGVSGLHLGDPDNDDIGNITYNHSSNYMAFTTNTAERMRITSGGDVGIGVTPATNVRLDIRSNAAATLGDFRNASATGFGLYVAAGDTSSHYAFRAADYQNNALFSVLSDGSVTKPLQPAFQAHPASQQDNIAVASAVTVVLGTEVFDAGANFASNTFTAPVTGKYQLNLFMRIETTDTAADYYQTKIVTSNRTYIMTLDPGALSSDPNYWTQSMSVLADMDASDTAYVTILQNSGTAQTDIQQETTFSGYLAC